MKENGDAAMPVMKERVFSFYLLEGFCLLEVCFASFSGCSIFFLFGIQFFFLYFTRR
jgi:hypothetical protein